MNGNKNFISDHIGGNKVENLNLRIFVFFQALLENRIELKRKTRKKIEQRLYCIRS